MTEATDKKTVKTGFYLLEKDVKNPQADRRKRGWNSKPVWPAGTRVHVRLKGDSDGEGWIEFPDRTTIRFDMAFDAGVMSYVVRDVASLQRLCCHGNGVIAALVPAAPTVGQFIERSPLTASELLAFAVERGLVSMSDLEALAAEAHGWDDQTQIAFDKKHEV